MKIVTIYEKVYFTHLTLIYDCKAKEAEEYLRTHKMNPNAKLPSCTGQTGVYVTKANKIRYYMYIEKAKDQLDTLVHELAHLVFMSLIDCGIKVTDETDEIFAYYIGWWYEKTVKYLTIKDSEC